MHVARFTRSSAAARLLVVAALFLATPLTCPSAFAAPPPRLKVSPDGRFLLKADGTPFFYLADTAWELFHRLDRKQAVAYLDLRAQQRYTAIQAVALAELDGIGDPNAQGDLPLIDKDPTRPAVTPGSNPGNAEQYDYWDHVDFIVNEAEKRGLFIAMLPTWARYVKDKDRIFTVQNAEVYGEFLGKRYGKKPIIWVLGGDRGLDGFEDVIRAMAKGIAIGVSGKEDYDAVMMTLHPPGGGSSSKLFHNDPWLDFNMHQTGHSLAEQTKSWNKITADYERTPVKPVVDGEPLYEDHPLAFKAAINGYSFDAHVRQRAYWDLFAGTVGHTYGNHAVWQMYMPGKKRINGPLMYWNEAIHRPGAAEMQWVRNLIESRPVLSRVPDQTLLVDPLDGADRIQATRGDGYAFIYSGQGRKFTVVMGKISGDQVKARWYNPRTGTAEDAGQFENRGQQEFSCPSQGFGSDWVLVLDDLAKGYGTPGLVASPKKK